MLQLAKCWFRGPAWVILWLHLPQVQAAREDQGVWPPGAPPPPGRALSTWTLASLLPAPMQVSSWGPSPSWTGGQDAAVYGREEGGLSLNLKAGCALAWAADSSGHKEGHSQRWGEQEEGWGLGQPLPLLSCLLAPNSRVQESQPARWLWRCTYSVLAWFTTFKYLNMGFFYTLDPGSQMWVAVLLNAFQNVFRVLPASEFGGLFGKNSNFQVPLEWPPGSESSGLEPRNLHSNPSPGDPDPQQSYRSTGPGWWGRVCVGGRHGEELTRGAGSIREKRGRSQVRGRCWPRAHILLLLFWFSSQPGLTPPQKLAAGRSYQNGARVSSCWPWGSRGLPCRREDPSQEQ